jgi:hypothetical protein
MDVIFFNRNFDWVKNHMAVSSDSIAFWYSDGLSSFESLADVVFFDNCFLEESIEKSFKEQYWFLLDKKKVNVFPKRSILNPIEDNKPICFYPSNDTHFYLFKNILENLEKGSYEIYCNNKEGASDAVIKNGYLVSGDLEDCRKKVFYFSLLVLGNDWGLYERNLNNLFLKFGKNTICLQESILDFNTKDNRLGFCSFPIFQGFNSLKELNLSQKICAIVGNPRFEELKVQPLPTTKKVFINVNFTYGIFEEARAGWVYDILEACENLKVDYVISQHPRDNGDFSGLNLLKSNAGIVHNAILESSVVVSRFSALILEAIALGRTAIYYNPHGEKMNYKLDPDNKSLFYADSSSELLGILEEVLSDHFIIEKSSVLNLHLGNTVEGKASKYVALLLNEIKNQSVFKTNNNWEIVLLKIKLIKLEVKRMLLCSLRSFFR